MIKGGTDMVAIPLSVRANRELVEEVLDCAEKQTGFRPAVQEAVNKALERELERLKQAADQKKKQTA